MGLVSWTFLFLGEDRNGSHRVGDLLDPADYQVRDLVNRKHR